MSAAERARELLAYYDSCRLREGTIPAVTADTTGTIRDLLAELDQAQTQAVDLWLFAEAKWKQRESAANERDAALATLAEVREVVHRVGDFAIKDVDGIVAIAAILDRGPR